MNLLDLQSIAVKTYGPLFVLENIISHRKRKPLAMIVLFFTFLSFATIYMISLGGSVGFEPSEWVMEKILGLGYLFLSIWLLLFASNAYFYSFYFMTPSEIKGLFIDYDLAYSIEKLKANDITGSFFSILLGKRFLLRTGVNNESMQNFLSSRGQILTSKEFFCDTEDGVLNLVDFVTALYDSDKELAKFLLAHSIQRKDFIHIATWIMEIHASRHRLEGWWLKDSLERIPNIGQGWSYGDAYTLYKYERLLSTSTSLRFGVRTSYGDDEMKEIEAILSKDRQANALLIGDDFSGQLQIISRLKEVILSGAVHFELKNRKIVILDVESLTSTNGQKAQFEAELIKILKESINAGNVILVIDNMPAFVNSVLSFGSDLASLLEPYLNSNILKVVALSSIDAFHNVLERNPIFMQAFETVLMKEVDDLNVIKILQNEITKYESRGMLFTFLALVEISRSSQRYFPDAIMPDKAIDLLSEVVSDLTSRGKTIIEKIDVLDLVEKKTGIPTSEVKEEEKDKLLNLENILTKRVIGQKEAISAISNSMRRARSGIVNPNRPTGSFLFLGPTGVGKTETTKALASVFFGNESRILRLDMSEYSDDSSLGKLIGSFESKQPGVLSSMLREKPYGVLLLDEFEKTTKEVRNLFLQILDEGFFSDGQGKKVIARNLIIIATSNAGSDLIWKYMNEGRDLTESKGSVIEEIISQKIYTPELLNRFDGVILFHPLSSESIIKIARISLEKLKSRLAEKGIDLDITDVLVQFVASRGTDPKFGARPINRAVSEEVEQIIAKKIIAGEVKGGSIVTLNYEDLK
jgi:ATP-dependent Clp protease ATP-binding subunit ClpC